jgi:hypothetical protein
LFALVMKMLVRLPGARYYSGPQGRFTSPDAPLMDQDPADPQSCYTCRTGLPVTPRVTYTWDPTQFKWLVPRSDANICEDFGNGHGALPRYKVEMIRKLIVPLLLSCSALLAVDGAAPRSEYRLLATSKTSSMEKEMNEAAAAGYTFSSVMGGETAFGGKETVVVMGKLDASTGALMKYRLLAASKTSTLEKELNDAGRDGYAYRGVTVFESAFGGREVAVILERPADAGHPWQYRVLATNRTSTMEKELKQAGAESFRLHGMCVGKTAFGGNEVISILSKADQGSGSK